MYVCMIYVGLASACPNYIWYAQMHVKCDYVYMYNHTCIFIISLFLSLKALDVVDLTEVSLLMQL